MSLPQPRFPQPSAPRRSSRGRSRRLMAVFLLLLIGLATLGALLTAFIDPLQFYHRPAWYTPLLSEEERYQNPGLARNYDYENIIIGTSMTENFLPAQVADSIGGTTLKLSMAGSTVDEHYAIAKLALETGKVKQVIWGLDYFSLKLETADSSEDFPGYLYDNKLWNDYQYWFNASVYKQFARSIRAMIAGEEGTALEHLNNWNDEADFGKQYVADAYIQAAGSEQYFGLNEESTDTLQAYFNRYITPLLQSYPDVKFYFYYPPYSVMRQAAWYSDNPVRFENQLIMRKWMYEQFRQYDNVLLFDFQAASDWTFDLDQYKDLSHHSGEYNARIAEAIGARDTRYLVTDDNIDNLNEALRTQAAGAVIDSAGNVSSSSVTITGEPLTLSSRLIRGDGELWLSAKQIAAALDASVEWEAVSKTVTLTTDSHVLTMTVGSTEAVADGAALTLEDTPLLVGGKALIPLAFTAEQLGWSVEAVQEDGWLRYTISSGS